jgi:hypothetical protein
MVSRGSRLRLLGLAAAIGLFASAAGTAHASATVPAAPVPKCQHPVPNDAHRRWEVVFGLEPTLVKAQHLQEVATSRGFTMVGIEVECNGYSVANAGFTSRAKALVVLKQAKAKGFTNAFTEDS